MRLLPGFQPLGVMLSAGGALAVALLYLGDPRVPDVEVDALAPLFAEPAERVEVRALGSGQTLGGVLSSAIGPVEQHAVVMAFQELASPRRMRVGTEVTLRYRRGEDRLRGVDVVLNPDSTVRLTRDDGAWRSRVVVTPVWTDTLFASGTIEDVLWNAVVGSPALYDLPPVDRALLIHHLDQVFQWQIDFSRQIQAGDRYRFAFERRVRPDGSMRSGRLVAAELVNAGTSFHAVWFDPEGGAAGSYYDIEGKSLRRAFLLRPLEFRYISSRFSNARLHPILGTWRAHRGVDYAAATGTPVMATADGVIVHRAMSGGLGNMVEIRHTNGYSTRYAHLSRFASGQSLGARVRQGDVIGFVGATGLATGPHLHYEMIRNGRHIDPLSVNVGAGTGEPVPAHALERWSAELAERLALLDLLPGEDGVRFASHVSGPSSHDGEGGEVAAEAGAIEPDP